MDNMTYFLVFIGCIFLSRIILNQGQQKLSTEEKVLLMELFSTNRTYTYIGIFLLILCYFILLKLAVINHHVITNIYFAILLIYMLVKYFISSKKMKENQIPEAYISAYLLSTGVTLLGFLVILFSINYLK
jgi:predicted membrane protein